MPGVNWQGCDKKLILLKGRDLSGANLLGVDFTSTDLRNTNLHAANLEKATLVRASLAAATANGARFARIEAYRTDFSRMDAQGASFLSAELQRSNFQQATLTNVDLRKPIWGEHSSTTRKSAEAASRWLTWPAPISAGRPWTDRSISTAPSSSWPVLKASISLPRQGWLNGRSTWLAVTTVLPDGLVQPETWPCEFQQE
jgi:uncharacterized protein YjbI with pentapeptide repeats